MEWYEWLMAIVIGVVAYTVIGMYVLDRILGIKTDWEDNGD